jgi:hypothetical protein
MIVWVIVIFVLAVIAFFYMKLEHQARLFKVAVLSTIVLLLGFSMLMMFNSGETDFSSPGAVVGSVYVYVGWLGGLAVDMWEIGGEATGRIIEAVNVSNSVK